MKLRVTNNHTTLITGGKDNLLSFDLFQELYEYLSVKVPGSNYMQNKKESYGYKWDGYRHLMNKKGKFATGFLPSVIAHAMSVGAHIDEIIDERKNVPYFFPYEDRIWTIRNDSQELRDYQEDTVNKFDNYIDYGDDREFYFPRGIADSATNAGKTAIITGVFQNIEKARMLLLIDKMEIFEQLYNALSVDFNVGRINAKQPGVPARFVWGEDITIAMVKTLHSKAKKSTNVQKVLGSYFNVFAVDECHKASAGMYSDISQWTEAGARIFVSGTPLQNADRINNMIVVGLSGAVLKKTTKRYLMDEGYSLPVKVYVHHNPTFTHGKMSYESELKHVIHESNTRCDIIGKIISDKPALKTIINFKIKAHGQFMYDYLKDVYEFDSMEIVHGTDPDRKGKISRFRDGTTRILICSDILKEGYDDPNIMRMIYARGGKDKIAISQWAGRIERQDGISEFVELHEFWDEGNILSRHSRARLAFLKKEALEINYLYENRAGTPKS